MAEDRPGPRIPLFIDDVKDEDGFQMTRSVYLRIESTGIPREWHLEFDSQDLPFLLLDGAGVIYCPDRATERFEDADQINQLISTVETHPDLLVESEDLWLPTSVFEERPALPRAMCSAPPSRSSERPTSSRANN